MSDQLSVFRKMQSGELSFSDPKIRTAYALNLCTVSVSQIIDYDDVVILEQEYEAILNNLNIERMPKDEALLKILKQLLDTITFFRMQEGDKQFIDREYQNKMKNAIWNAVPNFGLIVSGGNPVTIAVSLASQIGIGYMNYRKAKAENAFAYEKEMWQLERAAIEQFNGLRRELFDTAWRLVDAHQLPDEYRLTERQVKQYNEILMDSDELRRYERLDSIKDSFIAYPPFWYYFGNTANSLMRSSSGDIEKFFEKRARECFEIFIQSFKACDLLRENQIASSCALEYIDLLSPNDPTERAKIKDLLSFAIKMSGNANDVLQLCAFGYLRIGDIDGATGLFRRLINENYNPIVNAQLLSGYYVGAFLRGNENALLGYKYLSNRIDEEYLFPFPQYLLTDPKSEKKLDSLQEQFLYNQKGILTKKFGLVLNLFQEKYRIRFNKCVPVPEDKKYTDHYFDNSSEAYAARKADGVLLRNKKTLSAYIDQLIDSDFPYNYLIVFNDMLNAVDTLNCVQSGERSLQASLSETIINNREMLLKYRERIEDGTRFSLDDYNRLLEVSFDAFTEKFFTLLSEYSSNYIEQRNDIISMNEAEMNLREFCIQQGLDTPEALYEKQNDIIEIPVIKKTYLGIELIDEGIQTAVVDDRYEEVRHIIAEHASQICKAGGKAKLIQSNSEEFDRYFIRLVIPNKRGIRRKTVAILDDISDKDYDLMFTTEGIMQVIKGKMKEVVLYDDIETNSDESTLFIRQQYNNPSVNIHNLVQMILELRTKPFAEVKEKRNAFEMIAGLIKK